MRALISIAIVSIYAEACSAAHFNEFEGVPEKQRAIMQGTHEICRGVRPSVGNEIRNGHVLTIPEGETPMTLAKRVCAVVSDRSIVFADSTRAFLLGSGIDVQHLARIYDHKVAPYFWCKAARPLVEASRRERYFTTLPAPEVREALSRACLEFARPSFLETLEEESASWSVRAYATDTEFQKLCELVRSVDAAVECPKAPTE